MNKQNQLSFLRIAMAISLLFSVSMNFYFVFLFDKMDDSSATAFNNNTSSSEHRHGPPQLSALTRQGGLGVGASFHNKDKKTEESGKTRSEYCGGDYP